MRSIPDTQIASYDALKEKLPAKRRLVLDMLERHQPGLALFQVAVILKQPMHWVSGRLRELARPGLIEDSGNRLTNPASGKPGIVWRACQRTEPQRPLPGI